MSDQRSNGLEATGIKPSCCGSSQAIPSLSLLVSAGSADIMLQTMMQATFSEGKSAFRTFRVFRVPSYLWHSCLLRIRGNKRLYSNAMTRDSVDIHENDKLIDHEHMPSELDFNRRVKVFTYRGCLLHVTLILFYTILFIALERTRTCPSPRLSLSAGRLRSHDIQKKET